MTTALGSRPVVAMIHLPPLPGAGNYDGSAVASFAGRAVKEARLLEAAGFTSLILQNTHDAPTRAAVPAATLAAMSAIGQEVRTHFSASVGVNVHKNDGTGALAIAHAINADFVRVKVLVGASLGPEGVLTGNSEAVAQLRRDLSSTIEVWADLGELTSVPIADVSLATLADWTGRFGGADRLIVTRLDVSQSKLAVDEARAGSPLPVLIGGRTTPGNAAEALLMSDGLIVGSCLRSGNQTTGELVPAHAEQFMAAVRSATNP